MHHFQLVGPRERAVVILINLGISASEVELNDVSSVVTEALMLIATLTIMFFILAFDWNKFIDKRSKPKANKG